MAPVDQFKAWRRFSVGREPSTCTRGRLTRRDLLSLLTNCCLRTRYVRHPSSAWLCAGIELKWRPVERLAEAVGVEQGKLGGTKRRLRTATFLEFVVEFVHQAGRRSIADFPKGADHVVSARAQKCPRKAHQSFARVSTSACAVAG